MTGYHISIGYNGSAFNGLNDQEMWVLLKKEAEFLCEDLNMDRLFHVTDSLLLPGEIVEKQNMIVNHLLAYRDHEFGQSPHPIRIIEDGDIKKCQIMQLASTSDDSLKYAVRRAYALELVRRMFALDINVNLIIA